MLFSAQGVKVGTILCDKFDFTLLLVISKLSQWAELDAQTLHAGRCRVLNLMASYTWVKIGIRPESQYQLVNLLLKWHTQ